MHHFHISAGSCAVAGGSWELQLLMVAPKSKPTQAYLRSSDTPYIYASDSLETHVARSAARVTSAFKFGDDAIDREFLLVFGFRDIVWPFLFIIVQRHSLDLSLFSSTHGARHAPCNYN